MSRWNNVLFRRTEQNRPCFRTNRVELSYWCESSTGFGIDIIMSLANGHVRNVHKTSECSARYKGRHSDRTNTVFIGPS